MSTTRISESVARPVRTAAQMTPAAVITEIVDVFVYDMDERGYAAVFAGLTLAFAYIQNAIETRKGKAFLRNVNTETVPTTSTNPAKEGV